MLIKTTPLSRILRRDVNNRINRRSPPSSFEVWVWVELIVSTINIRSIIGMRSKWCLCVYAAIWRCPGAWPLGPQHYRTRQINWVNPNDLADSHSRVCVCDMHSVMQFNNATTNTCILYYTKCKRGANRAHAFSDTVGVGECKAVTRRYLMRLLHQQC